MFMKAVEANTKREIETCGILAGTLVYIILPNSIKHVSFVAFLSHPFLPHFCPIALEEECILYYPNNYPQTNGIFR